MLAVTADFTFPNTEAMGALAAELARGRMLYRRICYFRYAYEASALLGDAAGYEADIAAMHREARSKTCSSLAVQPRPEHDGIGIELAFASGRPLAVEAAVAAMTKRAADAAPKVAPSYRCRANVALAYLAEQRLDFAAALRLYTSVDTHQDTYREWRGPTDSNDDCFATAAARRLALARVPTLADGVPLPMTRVTARITVPPDTIVRVTFQAQPPVLSGDTPALFGNGSSIRHPWPARDEYFFVDARIADGTLVADLPPGWWLPQIELDPAGKWTLGDLTPCLTTIETSPAAKPGAQLALPDLTFALVP